MTIIITDWIRTDVCTDDEERLFIAHPNHDVKVMRYIMCVCSELKHENEREYFVYSFGCDSNLRALDAPWG